MFRKFSQWFDLPPEVKTTSNQSSKKQLCGHEGCADGGIYRAPKSRYHLESGVNDWHWFCLIHIRDYNARWNYYTNMTEPEIERERRADVTWQRPSWPLGASTGFRGGGHAGPSFQDPFDLFNDAPSYAHPFSQAPASRTPASPQNRALAVFGLSHPFSQHDLRRRYRDLVKKHHPDANGGSLEAEEEIKRINEAYTVLKNAL